MLLDLGKHSEWVGDTVLSCQINTFRSDRIPDPFLSGLGRAAEQVQKGVIPNKSRAEEIATQQFNAAKKEQSVSENSKSSFFKRRKAQNHRRSKSLGKVGMKNYFPSQNLNQISSKQGDKMKDRVLEKYREKSSEFKYGTISFKMRSKNSYWQESSVCGLIEVKLLAWNAMHGVQLSQPRLHFFLLLAC